MASRFPARVTSSTLPSHSFVTTMTRMRLILLMLPIFLMAPLLRAAEEITLATYNVELFDHHFMAHHASTQPISKDPAAREILEELRKKNDEDNWETAQVILD